MSSEEGVEQVPPYDSVPQATPDEPVVMPPSEEDSIKLAEVIIQARPDGSQIIPKSLRSEGPPSGWIVRLCSCFKYRPENARRRRRQTTEASMLPSQKMEFRGKPTLVLDLDETLIHSSFQPLKSADFVLPFDLEGKTVYIDVLKRPHVDEFLLQVAESFEVVIFTASLQRYADPLLDKLDPHSVIRHRLYRDHCTLLSGGYVKDISKLGRNLKHTVIVDVRCKQNSPWCFQLQPDNALEIESWFDNRNDTALETLLPVLEALAKEEDVRKVIPEIKLRRKKAEELLDTAKTGPDVDLPPIAMRPIESPPSHRGYFNSPRSSGSFGSFDTILTSTRD